MTVFASVAELKAAVGQHVGYSDWHTITQEAVNMFADATGDHQWIHVDQEKAKAGPFGGTIAHGYMTLALIPMLAGGLAVVEGVTMGINYGCNKVRFPSPVPVGSRVRAGAVIKSVEDVAGGVQLVQEVTIEREGGEKPCCVAETVVRLYV
jgi:acyl dehydratase